MDFLKEFKSQAIKYLIGYFFISLGLAVTFYIDTKVEIGKLKEGQEVIKQTQADQGRQISHLVDIHLVK